MSSGAPIAADSARRHAAGEPVAVAPTRTDVFDLWRALTCLGVLVFHGTNKLGDAAWLKWPVLIFGQFGPRLSIFFVLSGYAIALLVERQAAGGIAPLAFLQRRFLRIYPLYWIALLIALSLALLATAFNGADPSKVLPSTFTAWLGDVGLVSLWLGQKPTLLVSWFLSHVVAFYLLLSAALLLRRTESRLQFYAVATLLAFLPPIVTLVPALQTLPQFACGIALALAFPVNTTDRAPWRRALMIYPGAYGVFGLATGQLLPVYAALATYLFGLCLHYRSRLPRVPSALTFIAAASYSIYLVHVPVMSPAMNLARRHIPVDSGYLALAWLAHLGLGLAAGLIFYKFVEIPVIRRLLRKPTGTATASAPTEGAVRTMHA